MTKPGRIAFAAFAIAMTSSPFAAERAAPGIPLFNNYFVLDLAGLDISATPGIENLGANANVEERIDPSDATRRITRYKARLQVHSAIDNSMIAKVDYFAATGSYPDPATAVGVTYFCADDIIDQDFYVVDPTMQQFPCDFSLGIGVANSGATPYLVTGIATAAAYLSMADSFVDLSGASVQINDPESGTMVWRKNFPGTDGNWTIEGDLSVVGDLMGGDGVDEVRIGYSRERPDGTNVFRYLYYEIDTGNFIREDKVATPLP